MTPRCQPKQKVQSPLSASVGGMRETRLAGSQALRSALASTLASTRGLSVGPSDVLVTRGSQMALMLAP